MDKLNCLCGYDKNKNLDCKSKPCSCNKICKKDCSKDKCKGCKCNGDCIKYEDDCNICVDEDSIFFSTNCEHPDCFILGDNWQEEVFVGTVVVPCEKPSIEQIDSINADVQIISKKVILTPFLESATGLQNTNIEGKITTGRKLIVEGLICLSISYVSLNIDQSVHSFHGQIPFSSFIVLPENTDLDQNFLVDSCIEKICVNRVCERSIDLTAAIMIKATKSVNLCAESFYKNYGVDCTCDTSNCSEHGCGIEPLIIKGVATEDELTKVLVPGKNPRLWTEISVPELLTIPCFKPDVKKLLSVTSSAKIVCQNVIKTPIPPENNEGFTLTGLKLLVHLILRQRITYVSTEHCNSVHSAHYDIPISAYIILPDNEKFDIGSKFKIDAYIEDLFACAINERQVFKNTTLFIKAESLVCD